MAGQILEVQVQGDFLERLTSARPVQAVAELIWNAVDGDANSIDVTIESNRLGITSIVVTDDGEGMPFSEVSTLFTNLGGSWKRLGPGEHEVSVIFKPTQSTVVFFIIRPGELAPEYQVHHTRPGRFGRFDETEVVKAAREMALAFTEKARPR